MVWLQVRAVVGSGQILDMFGERIDRTCGWINCEQESQVAHASFSGASGRMEVPCLVLGVIIRRCLCERSS